jgi:putative endonuclease
MDVALSAAKGPKPRILPNVVPQGPPLAMSRTYFVYILANISRELYVGVTSNLARRVSQHRAALSPDRYPARHETTSLVYCEATGDGMVNPKSLGPFASLRMTLGADLH